MFNAASPRFMVTHKEKVIYWSWGYPVGWDAYVKPFLDLLAGPDFARG